MVAFLRKALLPILLISLPLMFLIPGCNTQQMDEMRERLGETIDRVHEIQDAVDSAVERKDEIDAAIETMPEGSTKDKLVAISENFAKTIEVGRAWLGKANESLEKLHAELEGADDPFDIADAGVKAAAPLIPPPWGTIVLAVGTLGIGLARSAWTRYTARKVIKSVDPIINAPAAERLRKDLAMTQGASGKRLVDEAQGKVRALPF